VRGGRADLRARGGLLYIIGASLFGGMLAWWVALAAHVRFRSRLSREDVARLPMRSPGGALASQLGFVVLALAIATTWVGGISRAITSRTSGVGPYNCSCSRPRVPRRFSGRSGGRKNRVLHRFVVAAPRRTV
jgi:hypothetical protein